MENQRSTSVLHVRSTDAWTISEALQSFLQQKQFGLKKLISQGYDGATTFAGKISGVHKQIQTHSAHAIHIHCSCHRLQLASIQAAASVKEIRMFGNHDQHFGSCFNYSPPKSRGSEGHPGCSWFSRTEDHEV